MHSTEDPEQTNINKLKKILIHFTFLRYNEPTTLGSKFEVYSTMTYIYCEMITKIS